ncbi:uracil/xanthine transporter [Bacillus sp. Marseille-P3661]|uniref:uracil/xanthine transporter n=1 Tax=Bacillus sp. Marseille-P3661 TaxID=1936234 RepID=UPI000C83051D|nr:uracil/xanthine transporter [Bacillus sp. Marseille-P3661]
MNKHVSLTMFSSVQWLLFIFANTVVVPISIANVFEISPETTEMMLRSSFIFTGLACMFQGWAGHRFPLMEGHSGLLWGVILNLGLSASSMGMSLSVIGGGITTGILIACLIMFILAVCNGINLLRTVFTPMVMTVYLFLLTFQLIFIFFKGMIPLTEQGTIDVPISIFSIGVVVLVMALKLKGSKNISNFSILIGLVIGWVFYELFFSDGTQKVGQAIESSFSLFPLGQPNFEYGIVIVTCLTVLLNLSNTMVSIQEGGNLLKEESSNKRIRNSIFVTTFFTALGSGFGLVPYTPFTSSIGFLQSTRIFERMPFIIGGCLLSIMGLIPVFGSFLVTMPISVGNAVLFVAYLQLFGTAFGSLNGKTFNSNTIFRLAVPVLTGMCLMNISPTVFTNLPILIQPFFANGLIMGVMISIILEKIVNWRVYEKIELRN